MLKVFDDLKSFQSLYLDNEDYLRALAPHLGSLSAMHLGVTDIRVSSSWEPQEILVYHNKGTVDIPDISIWRTGLLLMNSKAYEALSDLLEPFGEFLLCNMLGQHGYLFHCTSIHQFSDREATYDMHEDMYADLLSLKFDPPRSENVITGIDLISPQMYFSESLIERVKQSDLKGLLFSENLAAPLPNSY